MSGMGLDYQTPERHVMEELGGADFESGLDGMAYGGSHFTPDMDTEFDPTSGMAGLGCGCSAVPTAALNGLGCAPCAAAALALNGLDAVPNPYMPYSAVPTISKQIGPANAYQALYAPKASGNAPAALDAGGSKTWMWFLLMAVAAYLVYVYIIKPGSKSDVSAPAAV